jgi:hypothetical protein
MLVAVSQEEVDMAAEADGEMAILPARLHHGSGGQYLVLLESCILIAAGPRLKSSCSRRNLPRKEDATADDIPLPQTMPSSAAPTQAT